MTKNIFELDLILSQIHGQSFGRCDTRIILKPVSHGPKMLPIPLTAVRTPQPVKVHTCLRHSVFRLHLPRCVFLLLRVRMCVLAVLLTAAEKHISQCRSRCPCMPHPSIRGYEAGPQLKAKNKSSPYQVLASATRHMPVAPSTPLKTLMKSDNVSVRGCIIFSQHALSLHNVSIGQLRWYFFTPQSRRLYATSLSRALSVRRRAERAVKNEQRMKIEKAFHQRPTLPRRS